MPQPKNSNIEIGIEIEKEHKPTVDMITEYLAETGELPPEEAIYESIATDHENGNELYYDLEVGLQTWESGIDKIRDEQNQGNVDITPIEHPESADETSLVYIAHKIESNKNK